MKHPYEKFLQIEIIALATAIVISLFSIVQGYRVLPVFTFYFIFISLFFDALFSWITYQKTHAIKQFVRSVLVLILTTYIMLNI